MASQVEALDGSGRAARWGSCAISLDGKISWMSEGDHPLGPSRSFIGGDFLELWHPADRGSAGHAFSVAKGNGRYMLAARSLRGEWLDVALELRRTAHGDPAELIASIATASGDRTPVEEHRMIFNAVPAEMWVTFDRDANFLLGNPAAEALNGFRTGSNQSMSQRDVPDNYRCFKDGREVPGTELPAQRAARGEDVRDEEYEIRHFDGRSRHVILNASPMQNARGERVGSVTISVDITDRKRFENAQERLLQCARATGPAYFDALVAAISQTLGAQRVYVAEIVGENHNALRTLAGCINGSLVDEPDYVPKDTPCVEVIQGAVKYVPTGLLRLYPQAEFFALHGIDSYVGIPLYASNGEIIGIIDVLHDKPLPEELRPLEIVEIFASRAAAELQRIRGEDSLRQSEQKYRIITDVIPSLISFVDADERYQYINDAYKRWFGYSPDELKGQPVKAFMSADVYAKASGYMQRAIRGERVSYESRLADMPGGPRHILAEYVPQFSDDGRVMGFFAFVRDISEQKAHEEALRRSEAQFRTLFEYLPVGVAMVDRQGTIVVENDVLAASLPPSQSGGSASIFERACIPQPDSDEPLPPEKHPIREALRGRISQDVEFECSHPDGHKRWVRMRSVPIRGSSNEVVGALVVVDDIHNEKLADDRRKLLINELNHRVKNTLAGVQSIATQTFRRHDIEPAALAAFEDRLLALSNVHNQLTSESWEGADLRRLVPVVLEPHNPGAGRLRINGPSLRLKPQAALALAMALHELATNALKYGSLSVSDGTLDVDWQVTGVGDDRRLNLKWIERGGPRVSPPARKGFGTRLIERSLAFELDSKSGIRFDPEGVICEIDANFREVVG